MSKPFAAITAIILLSVPTMATAADKPDPRVQAVLACEIISANDARLQCYDQAIAALKPALVQGKVVLEEKKGPLALEGVVKASGKSTTSHFWVELENGDRWAVVTQKDRRKAPPPGATVKFKKTFFGNYWISGPKWSESEADFLGNNGS
jgi:hypothetical protein